MQRRGPKAQSSAASNETKIMILSSGKWGWRFCRPKTTGSYKHRCVVSQTNIKLAQDIRTHIHAQCCSVVRDWHFPVSQQQLKPQLSLIFSFSSSDSLLSFPLSCVCVWLNTFQSLSSFSTVVSVLSANLSEPQWRRPLPGLNSKENRKLGRPMKSESEDGESEKEKHGK